MPALQPTEQFLLFVAAPTVLLLSLLEALVLARSKGGYDWRGLGISYFDFVLRIVLNLAVPLTLITPLMNWVAAHRLTTLGLGTVGEAVVLFLGLEFCYYWLHRSAHRVRWFWANHAVHHSPNQLNLAASLRIGAFGKLTGTAFFLLPLVWLGFDQRLVFTALSLNLLYQFWLHATWIPKLGWLEWVFNTPSAHRVHHAANLEYLDANYGGVLIVFDRLFGTYIAERDDVPCRYGWVHPITSQNPFKVEFSQWGYLARDLLRVRSARGLLGTLFGPPGWAVHGPGASTEVLRAEAGFATRPQGGTIVRQPGAPTKEPINSAVSPSRAWPTSA